MRVALISDIHGNDVALEAVFADIRRQGADLTVCLGDVATLGPSPREVISRIGSERCLCIEGNHDEFLLRPELVAGYTSARRVVDAIDWCRAEITDVELDAVRGYVASELLADGALCVFHGSVRSNTEDLLATTPAEQLDEVLRGTARVFAGGHTHIQMVRQHKGALLVNPGSVGAPFKEFAGGGIPGIMPQFAEYAVVDVDGIAVEVSLRRVAVDEPAARRALAASTNPLAPSLLETWR